MRSSMARGYGIWFGIAVAVICAGAPSARAQNEDYPSEMTSDYGEEPSSRSDLDEAGPFSIRAGLGFMASPTAFLLGFEGDYMVADQVSLGGLVELGLDDDRIIVSPVAYGRYWFDLGQYEAELEPLVPYLQAGLGFTWWDIDRPRDDDDTAFLINFGFGAEYRFDPHLSLGSQMLFNFIPTEIHDGEPYDDNFYYSWEVLTLRYRF
jgi:hypothetical protein